MYTRIVTKNNMSWLIALLSIGLLFAMTQLTIQATLITQSTACTVGLEFVNETDERVQIFWANYEGGEELYKQLYRGDSWRVQTYQSQRWVVRDMNGNFVQAHVAGCGEETVAIMPAPKALPPLPVEVCRLCEDGVTQIAFKLIDRVDDGDQNERIRVRVGGIDGEILFDTLMDGNPYGHDGLYVGEVFTTDVTPGDELVLTVEGANHNREAIKARVVADCSLAEGTTVSENGYVTFGVEGLTTDNADGGLCEDQLYGDCYECIEGAKTITLRVAGRVDGGNESETVRVRAGGLDGELLFESDTPLAVGDTFSFDVNAGDDIVVTVDYGIERLKAQFTTDCSLSIGDMDGNSYIQFRVVDVAADNAEGDLCGPTVECDACVKGPKEITLGLLDRVDGGNEDEIIRVRLGGLDGELLYESDAPVLEGDEFSFRLGLDAGSDIVVTVDYGIERLKARFTADCSLTTGDTDGNSYIQFIVNEVVADNAEEKWCVSEETFAD